MPTSPNPIDSTIRARETAKVLSDAPLSIPAQDAPLWETLFSTAGWAPYHKSAHANHTSQRRDGLASTKPWRFYALDAAGCRSLREHLLSRGDTSKIPAMLATADVLVQATWLPDPPSEGAPAGQLFEPTIKNMEHIAAASAAIQNLLLAATARGIRNYWCTGGPLRVAELFDRLSIPKSEILLGSIFLFPTTLPTDGIQIQPGALRGQQGPLTDWMRWVTI